MKVIFLMLLVFGSLSTSGRQMVRERNSTVKEEIVRLPIFETTGHAQTYNIGGCHPVYYIYDIQSVDVPQNLAFQPLSYWRCDPSDYTFNRKELLTLPISDVRDRASLLPGVYQSGRGGDLNVFGSRATGMNYIVDGVEIRR